jgi:peptide/nickel transport system permease protein
VPRGFASLWRSSGKVRFGLTVIVAMVVLAVLSEPIAARIGNGKDPLEITAYQPWLVPSAAHPLGTDRYGRDLLAMTVKGLASSLEVGVIAGICATVFGIVVGFVAGYKGGWIDSTLATITDMFLVVPTLPILLTMSAYMRNITLFHVAVIIGAFAWPFAARTLRSQVLTLRSRPYVDLARTTKMNDVEIIFQELVPNLLPYIGVGFATSTLGAIFALVGIEVIGFGPTDVIDLGMMVNWAITWGALSLGAWPIFVAPIFVLSLLLLAILLVNIGLEETYNPRLRQVAGA